MKKFASATAVCLGLAAGLALSDKVALSQDKGGKAGGGRGPQGPGLTLTSPDVEDGAVIAEKFSMRANGTSPKLEWTHAPAGTQSYIVLFHDPDVSMQKKLDDVTHWMIFNIPGTATELPAGVAADAKLPDGSFQIKNSMGRVGYTGPGMGAAGPYHHYTFELYALDTKLDLTDSASRADVLKAADGHILAKAVLAGRYHQ
jgi:Raf kinase inhibitor-like YbhB/YbcL family protein